MGWLQKIFGICKTQEPVDGSCWTYSNGKIDIDLERAAELAGRGGAIRLEGKGLPIRVLVFHGSDGAYHAITNKCSHIGGRRIDPVPDAEKIKCCSVSGSTYDYRGQILAGPAKEPLKTFEVATTDGKLVVSLN